MISMERVNEIEQRGVSTPKSNVKSGSGGTTTVECADILFLEHHILHKS